MATRDQLVNTPRSGVTAGAARGSYYATAPDSPRSAPSAPRDRSANRPPPGQSGGQLQFRQRRAVTHPQYTYQTASGQRVTVGLPSRTYHRIVLAEFIVCAVLIAASPVLTPRTRASAAGTLAVDATVSLAAPLVRLTAVCVVFFVLALMASGPKTGKVAAAFGALVLLGTLLNATDMLAALARVFGPGPAKPDTSGVGTPPGQIPGTGPGGTGRKK